MEGFVEFVGALVVAPFVEGFFEEVVAEGFGVVDGVGVEFEPAAGFGEGGAGCEGGDGLAADEEWLLEEAAAHQVERSLVAPVSRVAPPWSSSMGVAWMPP
ncbi:MAG: hypothetical protein V4510_13105, partial [bacterium]